MSDYSLVCPVRLKKGFEGKIAEGFPWAYAEEIIESSEALLAPPGSLVSVENHKGQKLGTGYYNPNSQIALRVLSTGKKPIDKQFFLSRIAHALKARETAFTAPYYRLAHSESDFLPGLLIDRFAEAVIFQVGTAGMEKLQLLWLEAVEELLSPSLMILRNDIAVREREGLKQYVEVIKGTAPELSEVIENDCIYLADLVHGQKTGWFYDHRDNRRLMAERSQGKRVLDVYSHSGGFAQLAAKLGASEVTLVDSSKLALELAGKAAERNGTSAKMRYEPGDAFEVMEKLAARGERYDIVIADPPAFVKQKKDAGAGLKGYEKVSRLAASLLDDNGELFVASCSHHAPRNKFNQAVKAGVKATGKHMRIAAQTGAGADHPRHPLLPQSEYLKGVLLLPMES